MPFLSKKNIRTSNKKTKRKQFGGDNSLVSKIYEFLSNTDVNAEVDRLISSYTEELELYMSLMRNVSNKSVKKNLLKLEPNDDLLWNMIQTNFILESYDEYWPAGDYLTYGDFRDNDALASTIYDTYTQYPYPYGKKHNKMGKKEPVGTNLEYPAAIYICFIVPYVMAKSNLSKNEAPKGTFVFVYRGGGGGAIVENPKKKGKIKIYSCGHTMDYDNDDIYKNLGDRQYLIMLSDGTLGKIGNAEIIWDESNGLDAGIADLIAPKKINKGIIGTVGSLEGVTISRSRSRRRSPKNNSNNKVYCVGAPSTITISKNAMTNYHCDKTKIPDIDMEICWWDPLYFYIAEGQIENVDDYTLEHTALVWEGMSGGSIMNSKNEILGLHHRGDGKAMRADTLIQLFDELR